MKCTFKRGLDSESLKAVTEFFNTGVGKQIKGAVDPRGKSIFQACIRENYINIYWHGCSVLKYMPGAKTNKYLIHHKYIKNFDGLGGKSPYVRLTIEADKSDLKIEGKEDWSFVENILKKVSSHGLGEDEKKYGLKGEKKELAKYLEQAEDTFLDLEIAFSREKKKNEGEKKSVVANRIDLARLKENGDGLVKLQLVEVKRYDDPRCRSQDSTLEKLMEQLGYYQYFIEHYSESIQKSYLKIAKNYEELGFPGFNRVQVKLIEKFMEPTQVNKIDNLPHLLIISKNGLSFKDKGHLENLEKLLVDKGFPRLETYLNNV